MSDIVQRYREAYAEWERLLRCAFHLSAVSQGREVSSRSLEVASWAFGKLALHAKAAFDLAPKTPLGGQPPPEELWDISSMAVLVRAEVDTYYTLFYVAVDEVESQVKEFRWLLWDHHAELRRLEQLRLIGSTALGVAEIERTVQELTARIQAHPVYVCQEPRVQKKLRKGELGIFATNTELSARAGIDPSYYKTLFKFLSSYVHAHAFAMHQLAVFRAGDKESLRMLGTVLSYGAAYLSLAIRDFVSLLPDLKPTVPDDVWGIVEIWSRVVQEFSLPKSAEVIIDA